MFTVVSTLYSCWLYLFCGVFTDVYCYCFVSVLPCWKGFGGPELGWVIVFLLAGWVLEGAGWLEDCSLYEIVLG